MRSSAPRDTAHKWLAFGAMVAVAIGVSFASSCFKDHLKSTLPEPGPTNLVPVPIVAPPPVAPAEVDVEDEDPDHDAPAALEPRALPSGNAKSSLAAAPSWARGATTPYAPVHSRAGDLFSIASGPNGYVARAVVVCRARRERHDGDLRVRLKVGTMPEVTADGATAATVVHVSAPLVDLTDGTPIQAIVSERRLDGLVEVARLNASSGQPLRSFDAAGVIDCAALAGEDLHARIAQDLGRADSAVGHLANVPIDPRKVWGSEDTAERQRGERRISDVAALIGWDDPRVKTRVSSYDAATTRLDGERRRAFAEAQRTARREATIDGLSIVFERLACSPDACEIALRLENDDRPARAWRFPGVKVTFLAEGKERPRAVTDAETDPAILAPEASKQVLIRGPKGLNAKGLAQVCLSRANDMACGMIALR